MKCIDLTHAISPGMPVYPGTETPRFYKRCTIEKDGFDERQLVFFSHTGTHVDSPSHILKDGITLDRIPLEQFFGPAVVLDATSCTGSEIGVDMLRPLAGKKVDFVIFYTGWSHKWGKPEYFSGFPVPSEETASVLARSGIKGVGIDTISVDPVGSTSLSIHKILLNQGVLIIENLTNLEYLLNQVFILCCFPLKMESADGSPVRAVALPHYEQFAP